MEWLSRLTGRKAALVYPIPPAPPTVVLVPWFRSSGVVRVFSGGWSAAAAAFAPEAIAGTWPQLEALLPEKIPSLTHALIVVARADEPLVTLAQRRRLWNAFGVPVFQQIVGANGSLLGAECEAHDGLHIESSKFAAAGGLVEPAPCGCGRKTARLKPDPAQTRSAGAV